MLILLFLTVILNCEGMQNSCPSRMCNSASWDDSERYKIVAIHNNLRSRIAKGAYVAGKDRKPSATNMERMVYDCNLEASAQQWANTCPGGHSSSPGRGENINWKWATYPIAVTGLGEQAAAGWESELQKYGWSDNILTNQLLNTGIGHATQMVWWSSTRIGCGVKINCPSTNPQYRYQAVVVCHYSPQGNVLNQPIYLSGPTCSACRHGLSCDKNSGLCGSPVSPAKNDQLVEISRQVWIETNGRPILKSFHGTFLRAYPRENKVDLASEAKKWEHWYVEDWIGKVVLKSIHSPGRFLRAYPDGRVDLADKPQDWETWKPSKNSDGSWSFLSFHGQWLSANRDGSVITVKNRDTWEHFWLSGW